MSIVLDKPTERNRAREIRGTSVDAEEYTTRLELLYEVAQQASSYPEVLKLIGEILGVTQRILQASTASLLLIDEGKGELCFQAADGKVASTLGQMRLDLDLGIVGWVARHGVPVVVNDVSEDERFNKDIDEFSGFVAKSIIAAPLVRGQKVIGVLEVLNKADGSEFGERDLAFLTGFASTEALILLVSMAATAIHNIKLRQAELNNHKRTVETLVAATDVKDPYACGHSQRVREYTLLAANSLSFSPEELQVIEFGALLHDIGKIGVDDCILRKPTSLTNEEWYVMRKHSLIGANIVGEIPLLEKAREIVLSHHEWYNGTGYPDGRKGEDIPIGARLVAVADAFDTMITDHSYRAALSVDEAIDELVKGSGSQFCPVAVKAFVSAFKEQKKELERKEAERLAGEEAERETKEARKAQEAAASSNEGQALVRLGKAVEALEAFMKAIELDPKNAVAWRNKGTALGRLGRDEEALEAFVKAVELDPKDAAAWRDKGTVLVRLRRDAEALQAFTKAIELNPEYATTWMGKVTALIRLGRGKKSKKVKEAKKLVKREADLAAKEKAKREADLVAREKAKREADPVAKEKAKREADPVAKEKAKREADLVAKEKAKREADLVAKEKAKREADLVAKEKAKREAEAARKAKDAEISIHRISSELYEGDVQLAIKSSTGFEQVNQFRKCLRAVGDLKIVLDRWSEDEGIMIVVSLPKPMPLGNTLSRIPVVEQVYQENKKVVVELKSSATS